MITQKPISLKIDYHTLNELDIEVSLGWQKRNAVINQAIVMYLRVLDTRRRIRSYASLNEKERALKELCYHLVPESATFDVPEKYILSPESEESIYDQAAIESCTTDCVQYRQGTCPFRYNAKMSCMRFKEVYNRLTHPDEESEEIF